MMMPKELPSQSSYFYAKDIAKADLLKYPEALIAHGSNLSLTIGDLHGNSLLLLYALIFHGIVKMQVLDYERFSKLYYLQGKFLSQGQTPDRLLKDIKEMRRILSEMQWSSKHFKHVRLIGDEFSDRGQNDYFTFLLLELILSNQIQLSILVSNHGIEFLSHFANEQGVLMDCTIPAEQTCSWFHFKALQDYLQAQEQTDLMIDLMAWVKNIYLPALKLMDYELLAPQWRLMLYSHAPNSIDRFLKLFKAFSISSEFTNSFEMASGIEQLNIRFQKLFMKSFINFLGLFKNSETIFYQWIWQRGYDNQNFTHPHIQESILMIHGHDNPKKHIKELICLDSQFGKSQNILEHQVRIFAVSRGYTIIMAYYQLLQAKALELKDAKTLKYEVVMEILPLVAQLQQMLDQKKAWDQVYIYLDKLLTITRQSLPILMQKRLDSIKISSLNFFNKPQHPSSYLYMLHLQSDLIRIQAAIEKDYQWSQNHQKFKSIK
jgi:hypothetical protein